MSDIFDEIAPDELAPPVRKKRDIFDELAPAEVAEPDRVGAAVSKPSQPAPVSKSSQGIDPTQFDTKLTPQEETTFQTWKAKNAPNDSGEDYDLRGAFKAGLTPGENGHWADTFKKPNHPTFSTQSQYAKDHPELAGTWDGETYVPPKGKQDQPVDLKTGPAKPDIFDEVADGVGRAARAEAAGTGRTLADGLLGIDKLRFTPPFQPVAEDLARGLRHISDTVMPENANHVERILGGDSEALADLVSKDESGILKKAQETGKVPYGSILGRVISEALAPMLPTNPAQVAEFAGGPKVMEAAGTVAADAMPFLKTSLGEISGAFGKWAKERVLTKSVKVPVSVDDIRSFYAFARDQVKPEVYETLIKLPQDQVAEMAKRAMRGEDVFITKRVSRFGGRAVPDQPGAAAPGGPSVAAPLAVPGEPIKAGPTEPNGGAGGAGPIAARTDEPAPTLSPQAESYLSQRFPELHATVRAAAPHLPPEAVPDLIHRAAAVGEQALLQGADQATASKAAVEAFRKGVEPLAARAAAPPELPRPDNVGVVPHSQIDVLPEKYQFREKTDPERARNIAENYDPTQDRPIILRKVGDRYELLDGHHRMVAAALRGVTKSNAIIYENIDDAKALEIARRGNAQAVGYTPLEEAAIFDKEIRAGKSIAQIGADYGGKKPSEIQNVLNLNHLSGELKQLVRDNALDTKTAIALGQSVAEYGLTPEIQSEIYHRFIKEYDVTPSQLAYTMRVFGPKMMEQMELFGDLGGTETKRGFVSVLKEVLDQIKAHEKEATLFRRMTKTIDSYKKQGREAEIPDSLLKAYADMKELERKRVASIAELQKDIGEKKLPSLKATAVKAKKTLQNQTKAEMVAAPAGPPATFIPKGEPVPELPAGTASIESGDGTTLFDMDKVEPETVENKLLQGLVDELEGDPGLKDALGAMDITVAEMHSRLDAADLKAAPVQKALDDEYDAIAKQVKALPKKSPELRKLKAKMDQLADQSRAASEVVEITAQTFQEGIASVVTARAKAANPALTEAQLEEIETRSMEMLFERYGMEQTWGEKVGAVIDDVIQDVLSAEIQDEAPRTRNGRRIPVIEVPYDRVESGDIEKAYAAQAIAESGSKKKPPSVKTFTYEGKLFTSGGSGMAGGKYSRSVEAWELIPKALYKGQSGGYNLVSPETGYEGVIVNSKGKEYVLSNETTFLGHAPTKIVDGVTVRTMGSWTHQELEHEGFKITKTAPTKPDGRRAGWSIEKGGDEFAIPHPREYLEPGAGETDPWKVAPESFKDFASAKRWIDENLIGTKKRAPRADVASERSAVYGSDLPTYYSQLQKTVQAKMPNTTTPEQVKNIVNGQDVKKEEVEWSGIVEFLDGWDEKTITKGDVLDFLKQNEVKIREVVKGADATPSDPTGGIGGLRDETGFGDFERSSEAATKYERHTLPGGENYREMLFTLPSASPEIVYTRENLKLDTDETRRAGLLSAPHWVIDAPGQSFQILKSKYPRVEDAIDYIIREKQPGPRPAANTFHSSHFSERNVLAHVRFNERTDAEGKRVLFIEEVQSDWHQKGREKGYKNETPSKPAPITITQVDEFADSFHVHFSNGLVSEVGRGTLRAFANEDGARDYFAGRLDDMNAAAFDRWEGANMNRVPAAPFKKTWHELTLKRMLRWAADNGFDRLSWTTGAQQGDRYDLSTQIDAVRWTKKGDLYEIALTGKGGAPAGAGDFDPGDLPDVVGKEMARKITEAVAAGKSSDSYTGLDLRVGGEGMQGFYDQILPSFLNKYTKKWGGRVSTTKLKNASSFIPTRTYQGPEFTKEQIDAALKEYANARFYGSTTISNTFTGGTVLGRDHRVAIEQSLRSISRRMEQGVSFAQTMREYGSNEVARYMGGDMVEDAGQSRDVSVHSLDITPDMRRSVIEQGQPLFEKNLNLFGDEDMVSLAKPKPEDPNQPGLFSTATRPQFEVPASAFRSPGAAGPAPAARQPRLLTEKDHQIRRQEIDIPGAIRESVIVDRLMDTGFVRMDNRKVNGPEDIAAVFTFLKDETVENIYIVGLDEKNNVLGVRHAGQGIIAEVATDQRASFTAMQQLGAKRLVMIHNHPSRSPEPSTNDIALTKNFSNAAKILGMTLDYHVIIDGEKFGLMEVKNPSGAGPTTTQHIKVSTPLASKTVQKGNVTAPIVKPLQSGTADDVLTSPEAVERYAKAFVKKNGGHLAVALNTQNGVNGVWVIPHGTMDELVARAARISLRNNARSMIFATDIPLDKDFVHGLRVGLNEAVGVDLIDYVSIQKNGFKSAAQMAMFRDSIQPYTYASEPGGEDVPENVTPGQNASNIRAFNRRKIQVEILRAEIGINDQDWLKLKIELTGKNNLAEMNVPELEKMAIELRARKRGKTSIAPKTKDPNDPEAVRKRLDIGDPIYRQIREKVLGPEVAGRKLTDEEKKALTLELRAYPVDARGHAIAYDIPRAHGIKIDKKFAYDAGHYHDLTDYQRTFLESWRAFKLIDPSGHFKTLSFDKMEKAVVEEMRVVESIRLRMAAVTRDIKPGSVESARIMRWGEARYGDQYIHEVAGRKFHNQRALMKDEWDGEPLTKEQRRILEDSVKRDIAELKQAHAFDPNMVSEHERNIDKYLRSLYDELLDWQNDVRRRYGKTEIPKRRYYYTHIWEQNIADTLLEGLQKDQSKTLPQADYTRPNAPFNPFEIARRGGTGYIEDAIGVFDRYLNTAAREALYRPVIAEVRQMVKYLPGRSAQAVDRWLNDMSGKTTFLDRANIVPQFIMRPALYLSQRAKGNLLVGNFNFIVTNSLNIATTIGETGPRYALAGAIQFANPYWRNFAWSKSAMLQNRTNVFELDYSKQDAVVRFLSGNFIEYFNVGSAFLSGYFKAKDAGMGEKDAIKFADDGARRSQADYRKHAISPWMRSRLGKVFSMMGTYPFNLWHTLQYDYLRAPAPVSSVAAGPGRSEKTEDMMAGRKSKTQKMGHLFSLLLGVMGANYIKERVTGRPAYDLRSWIPNIFWLPPWLLMRLAGADAKNQARDFTDPFYFRTLKTVGDTVAAARSGKSEDWDKAGRELFQLALLVGPKYGGVQLGRFLEGRLLPKPPEEKTGPNPGARPASTRPAAARPMMSRPTSVRRPVVMR